MPRSKKKKVIFRKLNVDEFSSHVQDGKRLDMEDSEDDLQMTIAKLVAPPKGKDLVATKIHSKEDASKQPCYCQACKEIGHNSRKCHILPEEPKEKKTNTQDEKTKPSRDKDTTKAPMETKQPATKVTDIAPEISTNGQHTSKKNKEVMEENALEVASNRKSLHQEKAEGKKPLCVSDSDNDEVMELEHPAQPNVEEQPLQLATKKKKTSKH
ncbi:ankyrin repeat family protein, partial [Striga asiatica]